MPERSSIIGRTLLERKVVHVPDVLADPEYALLDLQRAGQYRTVLSLPLLEDGEPVGVIAMGRCEVNPYSDREIEIVSVFAEQAALVIRIATLLSETREALDRETAISDVLSAISRSSFDLDEVLQAAITRAVATSHADFGNILRLDESSGFYRIVAHHGEVDPAYWELVTQTRYKPDRGTLMGRTLAEMRPVHVVDILQDPEYRFWESQQKGGYRTILGVPMLRDGFPIGALVVWRREVKPFTEREISLLTTFGDQAALAIENVRLFRDG